MTKEMTEAKESRDEGSMRRDSTYPTFPRWGLLRNQGVNNGQKT